MYARRRGPSLLGCLATLVVTLLVVFLVVGWWRNWYDVSSSDDSQQVDIGMQINKDEVERDLGKLQTETQRLTESAQVAAEIKTIDGTVTDLSDTQLNVRSDEQQHTVAIDELTEFYRAGEPASLQSLQQGDQVRVTYQEHDAKKRASRVTLLEDEQP